MCSMYFSDNFAWKLETRLHTHINICSLNPATSCLPLKWKWCASARVCVCVCMRVYVFKINRNAMEYFIPCVYLCTQWKKAKPTFIGSRNDSSGSGQYHVQTKTVSNISTEMKTNSEPSACILREEKINTQNYNINCLRGIK